MKIIALLMLLIFIEITLAKSSRNTPYTDFYQGAFVQLEDQYENQRIEYIEGPFPYFISGNSSPNTKTLNNQRPPSPNVDWEQCERCWDCCCDSRSCFNWCDWCNDNYWFDCKPKPTPCKCECDCKCKVEPCKCECKFNSTQTIVNQTVVVSASNRCDLNRPVISTSEERPQIDVILFNGNTPNGVTLVPNSAALVSAASSRTIQYIVHNITAHLVSGTATIQYNNPGAANNPRHTLELSCAGTPPLGPCDITICQVDQIPGVSFAINSDTITPALVLSVLTGVVTWFGSMEIGSTS